MTNRSSQAQSTAQSGADSTAKSEVIPAVTKEETLLDALPGLMNDGGLIRAVLIRAIRNSAKSRAQIAEEISFLSGHDLTETSLNKYTAESRADYRWPGELDRAFCRATGDDALLKLRAELAGYRVIGDAEIHLLELGREFLRQQRAGEEIAVLQKRLAGVAL